MNKFKAFLETAPKQEGFRREGLHRRKDFWEVFTFHYGLSPYGLML